MVKIVPLSGKITVEAKPAVKTPVIQAGRTPDGEMRFASEWMKLTGTVMLSGVEGENLGGITLGWINIEWLERDWAIYRGEVEAHGSTINQRDTPAARKNIEACRDTMTAKSILVDSNSDGLDQVNIPAGTPFPAARDQQIQLQVIFKDAPENVHVTRLKNTKTGKINFLHEVRTEMRFCTVLTLIWPDKRFEYLRHIMWMNRWHYSFDHKATAPPWDPKAIQVTKDVIGKSYPGAPDAPWAKLLTAPDAPNCMEVAGQAAQDSTATYSTKWDEFREQRMQDQYTP